MKFIYCPYDKFQSMTGLTKTRSGVHIVLKGQSNNPEMKIMLIASPSGTRVSLRSVFDQLQEKAISSDGQLIFDTWCRLNDEISFYFVSIQNTRCEVKSQLCRYTAFAYILRNGQIEIYDCDNTTVTHKAYVDITMPVFYSIEKHQLEKRRRFHKNIEYVDSGYYKVQFECENKELYKTGYIIYVCGDYLIPVTSEMVCKGFYVKESSNEPEVKTTHKELIDLRRK